MKMVSIEAYLRHDQLVALLEGLKTVPNAAKCREEAVVIFFTRVAKQRFKFQHVLRSLTLPELTAVAYRLGWLNIIAWHQPDLRYLFHLVKPDEYEAAHRLAKLAVRALTLLRSDYASVRKHHQHYHVGLG